MRILLLLTIAFGLAGCKQEASRVVVELTSPNGQAFHFMPIDEDGVTDITIAIAWPSDWSRTAGHNVAIPYISVQAISNAATQDMSQADIMTAFADMNASASLFATPDYVRGEISFPHEHTKEVVPIANELLRAPQFDPAWIERISAQTTDDQRAYNAQDGAQVANSIGFAALGEGPFHDFLYVPDPDQLRTVTVDEIRDWQHKSVTRTGATIAVTGAISGKDAGQLVDDILAGLPDATPVTVKPTALALPAKTVLLHLPDTSKTTIVLTGALPDPALGDAEVDLLAVVLMGQQGDGPLFNALRTKLRAAYSVGAGLSAFDNKNRILTISAEVDTDKAAQARDTLLAAYEAFRTQPDLSGFDELLQGMVSDTAENVSYVDVAARNIVEAALVKDIEPAQIPTMDKVLGAVTQDQLKARLLSAFPPADTLLVVMSSPDANALPDACVITAPAEILTCP